MVSPHLSLLKWTTAFLVLSGYLALASVATIGPTILVIPLAVLAFSPLAERLDEKYVSYGVFSRALTIAYCCFLPLSLINLGLMTAVVTLAIYIQCYTLLHRKTARNYYHLYLMALFLLLAACVQSPEPVIGFVLLMFLVSAVWSNMILRIVSEEGRLEKPTEAEYVSLDFLRYHGGRQRTSKGGGVLVLAAAISLAVLTVTALAFVFTPRMEAGILGRNQTVVQTTGLSESVDLQSGSTISEDDTPVMMVQFPEEPGGQIPNADWLYWRVTTLNVYRGNRWSGSETALGDPGVLPVGNARRSEGDRYKLERTLRPGRKILYQTIYMDDVPTMGLPTLDLVQRVRADEKTKGVELVWAGDGDLTVKLNKSGARRLNYEVWSEPGDPEPDVLRGAPMDFSTVRLGDLELFTEQRLSDASVQLARSLTENRATLYDKAKAVQDYLSGSDFQYTLDIPPMDSDSIIDTFINQTRRGHCELFSTALALMLRSQGIPTRVVTGFRGGEWSESDKTYTIRANMAHLWVEVWFPGIGWVIFDPSPRQDDRDRSGLDRAIMLASRILLKTKIFWYSEVVGFDRRAQFDRVREFTAGLVGGTRGDDVDGGVQHAGARSKYRFLVPVAVFLALAGAFVLLIWRGHWMLLAHGFPVSMPRGVLLTVDQVRVVRLYLVLRRRLQRYGVRCAGKTAEELRQELQGSPWESGEEAAKVLDLYNAVRFGNHTMDGVNVAGLRKAIFRLRPIEP